MPQSECSCGCGKPIWLDKDGAKVEGACIDCGTVEDLNWMVSYELWDELVGDRRARMCPKCFEQRALAGGYSGVGFIATALKPEETGELYVTPNPSGVDSVWQDLMWHVWQKIKATKFPSVTSFFSHPTERSKVGKYDVDPREARWVDGVRKE